MDISHEEVNDGRATTLLITVVCPVCEFSGSGLPYYALGTVTCESCGETFGVAHAAIHDAQHALLVALGEAEPVET